MSKPSRHIGIVILEGFDATLDSVLKASLQVDEYYDDSHPMIDRNEFRKERGIRFIRGKVFDYGGTLDQVFNNEYDEEGRYVRSRIVHSDGTVIED